MATETLDWIDGFCECCNGPSEARAEDGAPVCQRCKAAGCNYAEVQCELADMDAQIARLKAQQGGEAANG